MIEGKLSIPKPDDFAGSTYQYEATFKAAIEPAAKAAAAGSSGQTAVKGTPLPAGGGAPGKAYMDYLKVLASGDQARLRAVISADRAKSMDDPDFKKMLPMIQAMAPKNVHLTGGYRQPIFAASTKSLRVRPSMACVQIITRTLPQARWMSG